MFRNFLLGSIVPLLVFHSFPVANIAKTNQEQKNNHLENLIIDDIKNIDDSLNDSLITRIIFEQNTLKQLFVLGWQTNWKRWLTYTKHDFNNEIEIDITNKKVKFNLFPNSFTQTYIDPDPKWCDPYGARWNNKTREIKIDYTKSVVQDLNSTSEWFGNEYSAHLKINKSSRYDHKQTIAYPTHNYFTHFVRMFVGGDYWIEPIEKNILIKEITNEKIFENIIQFNRPEFSNNNLVWNSTTINEISPIFSFNENLYILKTLAIAVDTKAYLESILKKYTINNVWTHPTISEKCIKENINKIENLSFNSYKDLIDLKNNLMNGTEYYINGDYNDELQLLNTNFINGKLISEEFSITLDNVSDFYNTIILFLKNNKISAKCNINNEEKTLIIWENGSFINLLKQVEISNINLLNLEFKQIDIEYIAKHNSKQINSNMTIDNVNYLSSLNFDILYRSNAINFNSEINDDFINNGLMLNINKYVSEIVGTELNGLTKNLITDEGKKIILKQLNEMLINNKNKSIFTNILDISKNNEEYIINKFGSNLVNAAKKLGISKQELIDFVPNNYDGFFYAIIEIQNWLFMDNTDGDFTKEFKDNFYKTFINDNNVLSEIKVKSNQRDDSGYFLCKFRTNKIIFDIKHSKNVLDIQNIDEVYEQIIHWYNLLSNSSNWQKEYISKTKNSFLYKTYINNIKYSHKSIDEIKDINLKISFSLEKNASPYFDQENQFYYDMKNSPLLDRIKYDTKKTKIHFCENRAYLVNDKNNLFTGYINLFDFINYFYDEKLDEIAILINNLSQHWIDEIEKINNIDYEIKKEINPWPLIITTISGLLLFVIIVMLIKYKKRK